MGSCSSQSPTVKIYSLSYLIFWLIYKDPSPSTDWLGYRACGHVTAGRVAVCPQLCSGLKSSWGWGLTGPGHEGKEGAVPGRTALSLASQGCLGQIGMETDRRHPPILRCSSALGLRRGTASPKEEGGEEGTEGEKEEGCGELASTHPGVQQTWVQILALPFASCVASGNVLLRLSFSACQRGIRAILLSSGWELKE